MDRLSHNHGANIELGCLPQRMEAYRGLAILTTNLKGALDEAFVQRCQLIIRFPFPDAVERAQLWPRGFPEREIASVARARCAQRCSVEFGVAMEAVIAA